MAKHVCPICEDVYAQPGTFIIRFEGAQQEHEAWHCPECSYAFIAVADAQKFMESAELVKAGDGVVRRRP